MLPLCHRGPCKTLKQTHLHDRVCLADNTLLMFFSFNTRQSVHGPTLGDYKLQTLIKITFGTLSKKLYDTVV